MVKVLVVEDEASIREMIALNLRLAGMEAVEADSAEAALPLLEQRPGCDAAILDVMLPGMNGFSLCETIRRTDQKIGIIILSAKGQEQDKIRGLSIGADDYMTKPFSVSELLARVEALCRRVGRSAGAEAGEQAPASLVSGSFVLDENRRVLLKAGKPIELTQVEFQRTLTDIMAIMGHCLEKNITLYSTKDGYAFDNSINSKVLCFAFGLVAEIERNLISLRTKEALERRRKEGKHLGRKKGDTPKMKILYANKRKLVREHQRGESCAELARQMGVSRTTMFRFLRRY